MMTQLTSEEERKKMDEIINHQEQEHMVLRTEGLVKIYGKQGH